MLYLQYFANPTDRVKASLRSLRCPALYDQLVTSDGSATTASFQHAYQLIQVVGLSMQVVGLSMQVVGLSVQVVCTASGTDTCR